MSWTDKKSLEQFKRLRDYYNIKTFIETGTFKGVNAAVHANNFESVITCEKMEENYQESVSKLSQFDNVRVIHKSSPDFLRTLDKQPKDTVFFYLDAHFYDPLASQENKWVVINELKSLREFINCVIVIHDFDCNGLGHLTYDGQSLNFSLIQQYLFDVNPHFHYYANTKDGCDILTKERVASGEIPNLILDDVTDDNLTYAWSREDKTYRGLLYCTPTALDLTKFELKELLV